MGISDRDYFRTEEFHAGEFRGGESNRPSAHGHQVTHNVFDHDRLIKWLIGINVAVFVLNGLVGRLDRFGGQSLNELFSLHLSGLKRGEFWRLITYGFCHANLGHILFNMFGLWSFGRLIQSVRGTAETVAFYTVSLMVSGFAQLALNRSNGLSDYQAIIGASGAVWALTSLSAFIFSRLRVQSLLFPFGMELRWMALIYIGADIWGVGHAGSHIAHWAHLGGALFGALYFLLGIRLIPKRFLSSSEVASPRRTSSPWNDNSNSNPRDSDPWRARLYEPPKDS